MSATADAGWKGSPDRTNTGSGSAAREHLGTGWERVHHPPQMPIRPVGRCTATARSSPPRLQGGLEGLIGSGRARPPSRFVTGRPNSWKRPATRRVPVDSRPPSSNSPDGIAGWNPGSTVPSGPRC